MTRHRFLFATLVVAMAACSSSDTGGSGGAGSGGTSSATGGATSSGGRPETGGPSASGGSAATGGSGSGGQRATGGATSSGGAFGTGGAATGGTSAAPSGGATGSGGRVGPDAGAGNGGSAAGGSTGGGGGGTAGSGGDVVRSAGCGKTDGAKTLTAGGSSVANALPTSTRLKITSGGTSREYIIDIPADYDPNQPHRLVFSWHQAYGSDTGNANGQYPAGNGPNFDAKSYAYFGLRREATNAKQAAIFVAPGGIGNFPWDFKRDSALFDELLALVNANLCIDESRVFTTGFSFGAMMSYALSITRQAKLRAAVTMAAANYNLPSMPSATNSGLIAYMGVTGMSDGTCPWVQSDGEKKGGKYCVLQHAQANGCTIPGNIQTTTVGSKKYLCYDFEGCKTGYPVKACTFDGGHTPSSVNDGSSTSDDGLKAFVPPLAWKFMAQF